MGRRSWQRVPSLPSRTVKPALDGERASGSPESVLLDRREARSGTHKGKNRGREGEAASVKAKRGFGLRARSREAPKAAKRALGPQAGSGSMAAGRGGDDWRQMKQA